MGSENVVDPQHTLLRVCRIGKAQGLKGEVTVLSYTDDPEYRYSTDSVLYSSDGKQEFVVEHARTMKNRWILKFEDVDDRNSAEAINGIELYGEPDSEEELLEEDAWYTRDLIGLEVRIDENAQLQLEAGTTIGKIVDVITNMQTLIKIRLANPTTDERTALVPFVEQIVPQVHVNEGYVTITPPGGLIPGVE
ncbi:MAG: ribosome maturation factor RimM [Bifidobacteriaceae bacterium]|nr:ribosome maturation factor RimM [Bifidobacteriaceae bacterium]